MGPRRLSKIKELAEKMGLKKAPKATAIDKTPVLDPEELAKAEAEAKEVLDQKKLEEYLATEIAPKQEKIIQRRKELKADELEEAIAKSQQGREFSGYKNWAEGGPTTEELRRAALQRFQEGKAEGARDIDLSKLKAAGVAGAAIGAGMLGSPKEAKAEISPTQKAIESAQKKYGASDKEIGQSLQTAGEWLAPFSKIYNLIDPTLVASEEEETQELERLKKEQFLEKLRNQSSLAKK